MIRKCLFSLVLTAAACAGSAQMSKYSLDFDVFCPDFPDTVGIETVEGRMVVPVTFGEKSLRFLFDTGASQTTIFSSTPVDSLEDAGFVLSHDANGRVDTVRKVLLPPFSIGQMEISGATAVVQKSIAARQEFDGILGFDIINRGLSVKIDMREKRLIFSDDPQFFSGDDGFTWRYRLDLHVPHLYVRPFLRFTHQPLLDTGYSSLYILNIDELDKAASKKGTDVQGQVVTRTMGSWAMGHSGIEPRSEVAFLCLDSVEIDGFCMKTVRTLTTQGKSKVGAALLGMGTLSINPKKRRMIFTPYDGEGSVVVDNRQADYVIVPKDGLPCIGLVNDKSAAWQSGMREGDVVVRIDNTPITSFADYLRFVPVAGQRCRFLLRDQRGFQKEFFQEF